MNYQEHFFIGLAITIFIGFILFIQGSLAITGQNIIWLLIISFVFSLLPDIDIGTSMIRKVFLTAFVIFILINGVNSLGYLLGSIVIVLLFLPHRGIMHTYLMGGLLSGLLCFYFLDWVLPLIALLNFCSHLILDKIKFKF